MGSDPFQHTSSPSRLHSRADYTKCESNFLFSCPSESSCIPTTSTNATVICCPKGAECTLIQPLTCDISQQDASKYPDNLVHTTNLTATLAQCGPSCCPLGYDCQSSMCVLKSLPSPPQTSSPPVLSPSSTSSLSQSSIPTSTQSPVANTPAPPKSQGPNLGLALGLTFGILSALLLILALLWCLKRRKRARASAAQQHMYGKREANDSDDDFMGTTPRPPEVPRGGDPVMQDSSAMSGFAPSSSSGPISLPLVDSGACLHRTDFLLRRGSVETGYEDKIKPSWSTKSAKRPKSRPLQRPTLQNTSGLTTPDVGRVPVFATPLRFGLPSGPKAAKEVNLQSERPSKGEANLARLVNLGGKTVPSGAAVRVENNIPPPSKARTFEMKPRDRSESQLRPLVRNTSEDRSQQQRSSSVSVTRGNPQRGRSPGSRCAFSDSTAASLELGSEEEDDDDDEKLHDGNLVTMNVLLPPPSVFRTPPPKSWEERSREELNGPQRTSIKRQTTYDDLIKKAGRW